MKSTGAKVAGFAALIAICVFFGIEVASSGLARVQGPPPAAQTTAAAPVPADAGESPAPEEEPKPAEAALPAAAAPVDPAAVAANPERLGTINRLSLALGDVLRYVAQGAIRFVADVIGAVLH